MINQGKLWEILKFYLSEYYIVMANRSKDTFKDSFVSGGYALSILKVKEDQGLRLVCLRNVFEDKFDWGGDYGRSSDKWNQELIERLGIGFEDFTIWMTFEDLIS